MHLLEIIQYLFILYLLVIQYHSSLFLEIKVLSLEGNNLFFFFLQSGNNRSINLSYRHCVRPAISAVK